MATRSPPGSPVFLSVPQHGLHLAQRAFGIGAATWHYGNGAG